MESRNSKKCFNVTPWRFVNLNQRTLSLVSSLTKSMVRSRCSTQSKFRSLTTKWDTMAVWKPRSICKCIDQATRTDNVISRIAAFTVTSPSLVQPVKSSLKIKLLKVILDCEDFHQFTSKTCVQKHKGQAVSTEAYPHLVWSQTRRWTKTCLWLEWDNKLACKVLEFKEMPAFKVGAISQG